MYVRRKLIINSMIILIFILLIGLNAEANYQDSSEFQKEKIWGLRFLTYNETDDFFSFPIPTVDYSLNEKTRILASFSIFWNSIEIHRQIPKRQRVNPYIGAGVSSLMGIFVTDLTGGVEINMERLNFYADTSYTTPLFSNRDGYSIRTTLGFGMSF